MTRLDAAGPGDNRLAVLAGEIVTAVAAIRASAHEMAERSLQVGRGLIEAKAALAHGQWEPWLRQNVNMSARSARRYMQLAASGLEAATVADLGLRGAAESLASSARSERRRNAGALAAWATEIATDKEVTQFTGWLERAAKAQPDSTVLEALANGVSLGWLERRWAEADEPVRRRFVESLVETKQARCKGGRQAP